ncbi:NAD(P)/FAD-dependent oxidoreductase [Arthrobacter sp. UM1]|nr:NAD(P)/FAD-dependent oxidoreductase [Arthrobacter sp. UM1]
MDAPSHVDTLVIGFGKAGKTLAMGLAAAGRSVALVEQSPAMYGGTCINIGCVPTKTLLHDAEASASRRGASDEADAQSLYSSALERKRALREKMNAANLAMVEKPGAVVVTGRARFTGERTVRVTAGDDELTITADHVVIGTGSVPRIPSIPGLPEKPLEDPRILTSTELIDRDRLPARLAVLGAGFIGLELANMYAEFGSEVTVLDRGERIAPHEDAETSAALEEVLTGIGVRVRHGAAVESVDTGAGHASPLVLRLAGGEHGPGETLEADALLIATGRVPATEGLGLEAAGVETDGRGAVVVDSFLRTSADSVWAVGDVHGGPQFTYTSFDDHRIVRDQLLRGLGERGRSLENRGPVPSTAFLTPPFARVGLTAAEAREQAAEHGWDVRVARAEVKDIAVMPRPKAVGEPRGFMQVVVDGASRRILGASLLCIDAQEVVNLIATAMRHGLTADDLRDGIYTHPSTTEALNGLLAGV